MSGYLSQRFQHYFYPQRQCPLGFAGKDCSEQCHPIHGLSNKDGICICESTKFTGVDCSIEVSENYNLISSSIKIMAYTLVGINFLVVLVCGIWLVIKRNTPQVEMSQPFFLGLVLIGCIISTSTIFILAQESTATATSEVEDAGNTNNTNRPACMAIPWLYSGMD